MKGESKSRPTAPCMVPCVKCGASDISRRYRREGEEWVGFQFEPCRETEHVVYRDLRCVAKCECLTLCCKVCGYSWTTDIHKAAAEPRVLRMRDDSGEWVTAGDNVYFSYGIPPAMVVAAVIERDGELVGLCCGHNPSEFKLRSLRRMVGAWYKWYATANAEHEGKS